MTDDFKVTYGKLGRVYVKNSLKYPSVTSIIHASNPWKGGVSNAGKLGTLTHYHILKQYAKEPIEMPIEPIWGMSAQDVYATVGRAIKMFKELDFEFKFADVERPIFYNQDGIRYAGRIDALGYDSDGVFSVLDLKTGLSYPEYPIQMSAYCKAVGVNRAYLVFLDARVDRNPDQKGKVRMIDKQELDESFEKFKSLYQEYLRMI